MEESFYELFLRDLARERGIRVYQGLPKDVDIVSRYKADREFLFLTNTGPETHEIEVCRRGHNLLTESMIDGRITLEPFGVAVLEVDEPAPASSPLPV